MNPGLNPNDGDRAEFVRMIDVRHGDQLYLYKKWQTVRKVRVFATGIHAWFEGIKTHRQFTHGLVARKLPDVPTELAR